MNWENWIDKPLPGLVIGNLYILFMAGILTFSEARLQVLAAMILAVLGLSILLSLFAFIDYLRIRYRNRT